MAIEEIDRRSAGRIELKQYTAEQPEYAVFAAGGIGLWGLAALLQLTVPWCRKFP